MFGETLRVAITVAVVLALAFVVVARFNQWSFDRAARNWLLVTSLAAIYLFTQHSPFEGHGHILDLNPFSDVKAARYSDHRRDLVLANIALFVPFGIAMAWRGARFGRSLAWAFSLSIAAEALQYIAGQGRIAQIDDVVFNTGGAAIGWIAAAAALWLLEGKRRVAGQIERRAGQDPGRDRDDHRNAERYGHRAGRA